MSNNKHIEKPLELPHQETIVGINTIQTKPFDTQKTESMNNKQSSVDWLIQKLEEKGDLRETPSIRNIQINIDTSDYLDLKRQAKAMHKEETMDFAAEWFVCHLRSDKIWHLEDLYALKFGTASTDMQSDSLASQILLKYEDENEYHLHEVDRKFVIEAMKEYALATRQTKTT